MVSTVSAKLPVLAKLGFLAGVAALLLAVVACAGATGPKGDAGPKGDQGPQGIQGAKGETGAPGKDAPLPPGTSRQLVAKLEVSKPANGTHFVAGEQPTISVTLKDQFGKPFNRSDDFAQLRLAVAGPQETQDTVTAVKLLKSTSDRSKAEHHYIDLKTNAEVQVNGDTLAYKLAAVSDEKPGTYVASLWAVSKTDSFQQDMVVGELQIGTATIEKQIVEKDKCAQCHLGADSGKFYFHHADQTNFWPAGNFAIDSNPVRNCKTCHNNEGYAAYTGDINKPEADRLKSTARTPDPIVRRVHGVHMGKGLKNPFNTDPKTGDFKTPEDYTGVVFPANVKNCTYCHVDDRWKTQPSRLACGACHDATWFGEAAAMPSTSKAHPGGPQANDQACALCHQADGPAKPAIAGAHKADQLPGEVTIDLALTAPANGKFYVAGEKPQVTISMKDAATGAAVDPNTVLETSPTPQPGEWSRVYVFVSGPRENTRPVLTTKAAETGPTASSYASNELRVLKDPKKADPKVSRTSTSIVYQLDDVAGLKTGTYTVFAQARKNGSDTKTSTSVALINFQVGAEKADLQVATNCTNCHGDTKMHGSYPFALAPDICKNCHDYKRQITGRSGWTNAPGTAAASNQGYGAAPIARRVHGVHRGRYLDKPEQVHRSFDYSEVIFPQDIRNCSKCHDAKTTSGTWKTSPSRIACLACHDSDAAITHASLQTTDPTPKEPYSGDELETCAVCHGPGKDFSPDKMHNISNPFKPPYEREPAEALHESSGSGAFVADNGDTFTFSFSAKQLDKDGKAMGQYQHKNDTKGHIIEIDVTHIKVAGDQVWLGGVITRAEGGTDGKPGDARVIRFIDDAREPDYRTRMENLDATKAVESPKTGNLADAKVKPLTSGSIQIR